MGKFFTFEVEEDDLKSGIESLFKQYKSVKRSAPISSTPSLPSTLKSPGAVKLIKPGRGNVHPTSFISNTCRTHHQQQCKSIQAKKRQLCDSSTRQRRRNFNSRRKSNFAGSPRQRHSARTCQCEKVHDETSQAAGKPLHPFLTFV